MEIMHFPDVENKSHLSLFNASNMIVLHFLRKERLSFHDRCVFPYNILVLVFESDNSGESFIDNGIGFSRILKENHFYFIPSGQAADYCLQPGIMYYTFHVGFEKFPGIDLFNSENSQCLEGDASAMIQEMARIWQDENAMRQVCRIRALLLDFFLKHWPEGTESEMQKSDPILDRLLPFISEQCNALMTVESLAEKMEMNADVFRRRFKNRFKLTPKTYLTNILLRKVMALLADPSIPLREVAGRLAFSSEFYLSRFMKKHTGRSPTEYRIFFKQRNMLHSAR